MSLDVYLELEGVQDDCAHDTIFIRESGSMKEISREEWNRRFPDQEPVTITIPQGIQVYWANITHNLWRMADDAGIYKHLWRPDELDISIAGQLIAPLCRGLALLESDPARFEKHNPSNGWGNYDGLVDFVREYLAACEKYPQAKVSVSR